MPQTVLSIATIKLSREMLRREDCYEGDDLLLSACSPPSLFRDWPTLTVPYFQAELTATPLERNCRCIGM